MNFSESGAPGKLYSPKIIVSKEPMAIKSSKPNQVHSPDLALVGSGISMEKAYLVRFINTITGGITCSAYFNLSKPSMMMNKSSCGNVLGGAGAR